MAGTITHSWNGTILTITSDSGTSAMDLKGAKGDDGPRGPQGLPGDANLIDAVERAETAATEAETALSQLGTARDEAVVAAAQAKAIVAGNEAYTKAESDKRYANAIKPTVKDNIVSITDGADAPTEAAISHIEPIQAGSGTPSPTNIRAIGGWDSINIKRTGKNLYGFEEATFTQRKTALLQNPIPAGTYAVSATCNSDDTNEKNCIATFLSAGRTKRKSCTFARDVRDVEILTVDFPISEMWFMASSSYDGGEGDTATWKQVQIERGTTATAYEPYNGTTLTATLPQTIYGGELDWNTGVLTVNRYLLTLNGTENYTTEWSKSCYTINNKLPGIENDNYEHTPELKCSHATWNIGGYISNTCYIKYNRLHYDYDNQAGGIDAFKAWLAEQYAAGTPVQVAYKLETPQTYQLTPQQLDTIKGSNNVWSDCGETTLTYVADTKLYIDNKFNELSTALVAMGC